MTSRRTGSSNNGAIPGERGGSEESGQVCEPTAAGAFSKIFQVGKDLDEVILRALLPDDFRHPAVSKADCANLPNARHFRGLLDAR